MILEQETRTIVKADEGKLLVRKSDGQVVGEVVHLGYNYYDAGVMLAEARRSTPEDYEEIDRPADYEENPVVNNARRYKRASVLIAQMRREANDLGFTPQECIEFAEVFPRFGIEYKEGDTLPLGIKFTHNGTLYACTKEHTILPHYYPSKNTAHLYTEVTENYVEPTREEEV